MRVLFIGFMLFSLFFGAGNLIYPVGSGQLTGDNFVAASLGFISTGVLLPLLGVIALALSGEKNILKLSQRGGIIFGLIFTTALFLTIGPLFAMPRTGAVSFDIAFGNLIDTQADWGYRLLYTVIFFGLSAYCALNPSKIVDIVGKVLTPPFLIFLGLVILVVIFSNHPDITAIDPEEYTNLPVYNAIKEYNEAPFLTGFIEGYLTLDALASLVFGLIVINSILGYGIKKKSQILSICIKSGLVAALLLAILYFSLFYMSAITANVDGFGIAEGLSGAALLSKISLVYLGSFGNFILAVIVILGCITTNIGLTCALGEYFASLFGDNKYQAFVWLFSIISCLFANFGLGFITQLSIPILLVLYPIAIVLIFLTFLHPTFKGRAIMYYIVYTVVTVLSILFTAIIYLKEYEWAKNLNQTFSDIIPFYEYSLGWLIPVVIALIIGYIFISIFKNKSETHEQSN